MVKLLGVLADLPVGRQESLEHPGVTRWVLCVARSCTPTPLALALGSHVLAARGSPTDTLWPWVWLPYAHHPLSPQLGPPPGLVVVTDLGGLCCAKCFLGHHLSRAGTGGVGAPEAVWPSRTVGAGTLDQEPR